MNTTLKMIVPGRLWNTLERIKKTSTRTCLSAVNRIGLNFTRTSDYYSPLPVVSELRKNSARWYKPSQLAGLHYDLEAMRHLLSDLVSRYAAEYQQIPPYAEMIKQGFGPGYTALDAMILYFMLRYLKPRSYLEVGSGLSTYYATLAAQRNAKEGVPLRITCIEPHPYAALRRLPNTEKIQRSVQDVALTAFEQLGAGDVLFIDSSHVLKIDGDVPYLYLEVLPRLQKGVFIHIHDVPFPYNVPYPPELWIFQAGWPKFWNEAMLLQAFLCFNDVFKIVLSTPLLRYFDETFLQTRLPNYEPVSRNPNTFSSIWIEKIK
jgi:predicted O-methyltransferase YrrM